MANNNESIRELNRLLNKRDTDPAASLAGCLIGAVLLGLFGALVVLAFNFFVWALPALLWIAGGILVIGFLVYFVGRVKEEMDKQK